MDVEIIPHSLGGTVKAVPSKSDVHRVLICAALSDRRTTVEVHEVSDDILSTARCLEALGAGMEYEEGLLRVTPGDEVPHAPELDCGESGSTLRFLLPVAAAVASEAHFTGRGRLPDRPIGELAAAMKEHGVRFTSPRLPFAISGRLRGGVYEIPGDISSQYITGLLLALPVVGGGEIRLTSPLKSAPYVRMTERTMSRFGVEVEETGDGWRVKGTPYISPGETAAEGDWSNAAFFLTAGALGDAVTVSGLSGTSPQGDRRILEILGNFGAKVSCDGGARVSRGSLAGITVDLEDVPDLLPILAVCAAFARGETRFVNGARLRLKESDRLMAVSSMLRSLGGDVTELADGLTVRGGQLRGGAVDGFNDHRIVMAAAIAGAYSSGPVTISGAEAVNKSYPSFFRDFNALGGISRGV